MAVEELRLTNEGRTPARLGVVRWLANRRRQVHPLTGAPGEVARMQRAAVRIEIGRRGAGDDAGVDQPSRDMARPRRLAESLESEDLGSGQLRREHQAGVDQPSIDDRDAGAAALPGRTLSGSPEHLTDALGRYQQQGLHEFALPGFTLGRTPAERLDTLEALHAAALSQFI